jgi:hypothetical protein
MTVDNVTILGWQKYLVNLLPSCTCGCSLLISVGDSEQFNGDCRRSFLISIIDILLIPDFCFLLHSCAVTQLTTLVSSSQHSTSHKQLHLCSKTQTQTQTKTKTGQIYKENSARERWRNQFYISMFCFVINFRIVKQIEGVIVFAHCETNKQTNQPSNQPTHFIS